MKVILNRSKMLFGSAAVALTACSGGNTSKTSIPLKTSSTTLKPISIRRARGSPRFTASRSIRDVTTGTVQAGPGGYAFQTHTDGYVNMYKPDGSWAAQTDTSGCTDDAFNFMLTGVDGSQSTASVPTPWTLAADTTYNGSINGPDATVPYQLRYDSGTRTSTVTLASNAWWKVAATGQQGSEQYTYTDSSGATYQIPTAALAAMTEGRAPRQAVPVNGPNATAAPVVVGTQSPCTAAKLAECDQWRTLIWATWALALVAIGLAFIGCLGLLAWWTIGAGAAICAGLLAIALAAFTAMVFSTRSQFLLVCSNCQLSV